VVSAWEKGRIVALSGGRKWRDESIAPQQGMEER